ncbi:MAG: hypothetical protein A2W82_02770 [Sulfurimonas sp. RIFCSPLOWO2_12_36_12]|uniref:DUF748 domain-containing protein n=1 Tax=Sulfurimonas sp. RIFCSPLOWO2_12_36_12 TaxID=1802253 RepID=UPI0008CA2AE7|nr:DUF748 domain-containing protein [Sulfurimonas sp. RIFCSPLOWO2_12_36_12]OHE00148.1 MAG: hypothetical protein A2W82_02770 [Sulfurimonas sp. RIFCSPLOWO2_12_36_12]
MFKKILLSLIALYAFIGFVILPIVLKSQIVNIVSNKTDANLSIESIYFNPFFFKLEINGAELRDLNNKELVSFDSLKIDLEPHSLMKSALHVKSISIDKPKFFVVYFKDRTFNFSKLLKESGDNEKDDAQEDFKLPRVVVDAISVDGGVVDYQDFTNPTKFEFEIDEINFKLTNIDTNDFNSSDATLRFNSALGDGGFVDFRSRVVGFKPLVVEGSLKFEASKLYTQWKYMQDRLGIEVADGKVSFGADYHLNVDDLNSTIIENMYLTLDNLRVKPKKKHNDILNLKSFSATDITIKPMAQNVHVKNISFNSLNAKIKRDINGEIDWVGYLKNEQEGLEDEKAVKKADSKSAPWSVTVDSAAFKKFALDVEDNSVSPAVKTKLNELNVYFKNLTLLGEKPLTYKMDLLLNDKASCSSQGSVKHKSLEVNSYLKCSDLDIVHYQPYIDQIAAKELKTYNIALKNALGSFDANLTLKDENSVINALVSGANLTIDNFVLERKDNSEKLADFRSFDVRGINLSTKTKDITVERVALNDLAFDIQKEKNSTYNFNGLVEAKENNVTKKSSSNDVNETQKKPYLVKLNSFDLNSARVNFDDKSVGKGTKTVIDKINLALKNIDSRENSWLNYTLSLRVNSKGEVKSSGDIKHTPLEQKGAIELDKISLKELTPYIVEVAFLKVSDGYLGLKGKTTYKQKDEKPYATVNGSLVVNNFFLHDSRDNSTIASFLKANLKSFNYKTTPNSLYINEILLDSFYLDAQIDKDKSMNLAKLMREKKPEDKKEVKKSSESKKADEEKFTFKLLNLKVSNGSANFADYSLPIDFKTHIHDLNGNVYAISNNKGEVSYVDVDGAVDEYGSTKLQGSIETSDFKSFTDINFNFRNLSLDSFSGYSAQFAGYKIDKGKLFLDLGYKIHNSEMLGKNSLIIKNIELGDEIEDENITKLPLGFAIALLEDSEGVIDINMPVEGNLNQPDFKYGAMVLKTFVNLIVKAVTSPFRFLGEALGISGEDLKFAEFEPSEFLLLPPEREKLDNVAQIMLKKPKLSLGVIGGFDSQKDKKAIQAKKVTQEILKKSDNKNIVTIKILENICSEFVGKDRPKALKEELEKKYKKEVFTAEYQKGLLAICTDAQSVSPDELRELANKRARVIGEYLVQTKNIDSSRVTLHEVKEMDDADEKWVKTALEIEVK